MNKTIRQVLFATIPILLLLAACAPAPAPTTDPNLINSQIETSVALTVAARHPMAFVYELIRLGRKDLYLFGHSPGGDWDLLIGAGCVKRVELAYEADEAFGTVGPCWRRAVEAGRIEWEDYSNFTMVLRFAAGAMGLPFLPTRSLLGSDVLRQQALTDAQRAADPRTYPKKLHVMESPFDPADRVVLVPAVRTDFAVLHVQKATPSGIVRIEGQTYADVVRWARETQHPDGGRVIDRPWVQQNLARFQANPTSTRTR